MFVRDFRIYTHHFRMVKCRNKPEVVAGSGHIDICTRFVRFGFKSKSITVSLVKAVLAQIIDGLPQTLDGLIGPPAGIGLDALAATPENENLGAQFCAQIHCAHGLL